MRVGASHEGGDQMPARRDVVEEVAGPAQKARILDALDAGARVPDGGQSVFTRGR